ncbi:MAG TPA: transglycosylase SLT domain-containing protein [Candidatus Acidoferrales bacterium]|nr:transglycosylase SLT domain-containing protein [Candidatus Acidoferrales bacterium]
MAKGSLACIAMLVWLALARMGAAEDDGAASFARAYSLFRQNQLEEAEALFRASLRADYLLSDYSLYFLGRLALERGAPERARRHLLALREKYPDSVWTAEANLRLGRLALAARDYAQALAELRALFSLKGRDDIACEARFLTAQIHALDGRPEEAYAAYQDLRRTFPLCSWAQAATAEAERLRLAYPESFPAPSYESLIEEAELRLRQRQYREAETVLRKLLENFTSEGARALWGLARVYAAQGKRAQERSLLELIANKHAQSPEAPQALNRLARLHWNADDNDKAFAYFRRLLERYPESPFADSALIAAARIHLSFGRPRDAVKLLSAFERRFPTSALRVEAQWRLAWIYYVEGDYERAYGAFKTIARDAAAPAQKAAALYWQGRTAEKIGREQEAKDLYRTLAADYDESYYAGPARQRLEINGAGGDLKPSGSSAPVSAAPASARVTFHLARARELARLALYPLGVAELDAIRDDMADPPARLTLVREYAALGAYHRSVPLAVQIAAPADEIKRHRYPLAYWDLVRQKAEAKNLDPYLVLALIRQESLFDPRAVSSANAIGLMQLLPSTAARLARQLGLAEPRPEELFDPNLNVTLGCQYLEELLRLYGNDPVKALAAYNAGEKAVARWERQIATDDPDEFIERITYGETHQYVKLVLRSQRLYRSLYAARP